MEEIDWKARYNELLGKYNSLVNTIIQIEEIEEQKSRAASQFNEEIKAYREAVREKARNAAQLDLPFSNE